VRPCGSSLNGAGGDGLTFGAGGGLSLVVYVESRFIYFGSVGRRHGDSRSIGLSGRSAQAARFLPEPYAPSTMARSTVTPTCSSTRSIAGSRSWPSPRGAGHIFNIQDELAGLIHAGGNLEPVKLLRSTFASMARHLGITRLMKRSGATFSNFAVTGRGAFHIIAQDL